ncbi:aminopeptidase PepB [Volucribacter amazonae]|nr:aminopeptidase PepB [Volucribacter amazonae]
MEIKLSNQVANEQIWGKNAILSFTETSAIIHLKPQENLILIQKAARKLRNQGIKQAKLTGEGWNWQYCWAFQQGFYSSKQEYQLTFPDLPKLEQRQLTNLVDCSQFTREIINLPATVITPEQLAQRAAQFITQQAEKVNQSRAVKYHILNNDQLHRQGYLGIWNVGKGSVNPPVMLQLDFNPTGDEQAPVLASLVGKGITFDSGGYSLKPSNSMDTMRSDMGGAALLTGALGLAIAQGLKQRVKLYLCCAENMVSSHAFKLGDIIEYRNGVSVEVLNTDAEGRLVLADGLIDADKDNAKLMIDCATLTGAAKVAVGNDYHSVLTMDDKLAQALFTAAEQSNEPFWRLPFAERHRGQIDSAFADIANVGSVPVGAGASTATAFLSYFVQNYQQHWLHIDCSATFCKSGNALWAAGATGLGIQTLATLLLNQQGD